MVATTKTKKAISTYLMERSGRSSHGVSLKFLRNSFRPSLPRYSEKVPTGQSQLQNVLRSSHAIERNAISKNTPAGCMDGRLPVSIQAFRFIKDAIGSQPSIPGGR